jgi:Ca2+-binding EF-hand superfamily protein
MATAARLMKFKMLDKNGDGTVTQEEFPDV